MGEELVRLDAAGVFRRAAIDADAAAAPSAMPLNRLAYDGAGRIFVWNGKEQLLHAVEVQSPGGDTLVPQLYARSDYLTLKLSITVGFSVQALKFNRTGQLLLLAGDRAMLVVNVVPQGSSHVCRAEMIGREMFDGRSLRIIHVAWHPYSDTHVGVLSSDGVFRLFNLAGNAIVTEQEYHLQVACRSKVFSRAVSFAFGGEHFWDRFTVFILFTDASIYALCPIVPFGSLHNAASLKELSGQTSSSGGSTTTLNESSSLAAVWLEMVFPELAKESSGSLSMLRARPQVPFNASLVLQGPLPKLSGGGKQSNNATGLLYSTIGKDSVLAVSTRSGELVFYALADEVQPMWSVQSSPRLLLDDFGDVSNLAMLVEPSGEKAASEQFTVGAAQFEGPNPPLLQLASVDLALQADVYTARPLGIFSDPLVPERIYCHHALGLDTVQLQWLPFSDAAGSGQSIRPPLVFPVLDTSPTGDSDPVPLLGAAVILQSSGETWLVAFTATGSCAVIELKPHLPLPPLVIDSTDFQPDGQVTDPNAQKLLSGDLILGPKDIHIPLVSPSTPLTLEMVEGRSVLHDQCKLLHEKYIEYAHRVFFELNTHHRYLGQVVHGMETQLRRTINKLEQGQEDSDNVAARINRAFEKNKELQERIRECNKMPALKQKILTVAEREFKDLLDTKVSQDVDILQSAVESLSLRADRVSRQSSAIPAAAYRRSHSKPAVPDIQMRALRQAMDRLAQYIELSGTRLDVLDQAIKRKECQLES